MKPFVISPRSQPGGPAALTASPWPETHPYAPTVTVDAAWVPEELILRFDVREKSVRALETDPWGVFNDSCVEFFFSLQGEEDYFNLEANPVGRFLFARGPDRHRRTDLTDAATGRIVVEGSQVGAEPFAERWDLPAWDITLHLPAAAVPGLSAWGPGLEGMTANFYKCGDGLSEPHYLAWRAPETPEPDYHRPEYFAPVIFLPAGDGG